MELPMILIALCNWVHKDGLLDLILVMGRQIVSAIPKLVLPVEMKWQLQAFLPMEVFDVPAIE
jgi:hypothetical protein